MKIAIKANPNRGKEIISLLESLGGIKGTLTGSGTLCFFCYYIDKNNLIRYDIPPEDYKVYTLEEFEKEFPFKVGDLCIYSSDILGKDSVVKILGMTIENDCIMYEVGHKDIVAKHTYIYRKRETLKPYKEMKEERNITLTLEKAKEWYNKGEELREIALQTFTEKELTKTDLPKTWEEFCENYPVQSGECWLGSCDEIYKKAYDKERIYKNWIPSRKSAEAHLAMIQLEQLRDCWRQGWKPTPGESYYVIKLGFRGLDVYWFCTVEFLSFPTKEMAEEFLKCFRDLIEQAGDLI